MLEKILKSKQLRCDCHCPGARACSARSASLSRRCPGASGLMAGGMCSFLPLISIPGDLFAILSNGLAALGVAKSQP